MRIVDSVFRNWSKENSKSLATRDITTACQDQGHVKASFCESTYHLLAIMLIDSSTMIIRGLFSRGLSLQLSMSTAAYTPACSPLPKAEHQTTEVSSPQRLPSPRPKNPDHIANTGVDEESTYVLTLRTEREFHQRINRLRKQYFPSELNKIGAHITLFHALPGSQLTTIIADITSLVHTESSFTIRTIEPIKMSHGIALNANSQDAHRLWDMLAQKWGPMGANFLSKQDQHFNAHYTIQNKVEKDVAQKSWEEVTERFKSDQGRAIGFTLYKYLKRGNWRYQQAFTFDSEEKSPPHMASTDFPPLGDPAP